MRERTTIFIPEAIQVDLALVIDVTGSMQEEINGIIKALKTFIAERDASTAPLMALLTFGDDVKLAALLVAIPHRIPKPVVRYCLQPMPRRMMMPMLKK